MKPKLSAVTRRQGNNAALLNGDVVVKGIELAFQDVPVLVHAFRRMVRELEFDVCEMALTTYLCAREHGVRFTAIPVFLVRGFHHGAILHDDRFELRDAKDLEGRRVGVNRGYTVTTGVWARSVLQVEHGVDLGKVTWVLSGDEHVTAYQPPANVVSIDAGATIEEQLHSGELAAAININTDDPHIRPLIANPLEAGLAAYRSRGHYPINHLIVLRNDVLEAHPDAAVALFRAFAASKDIYLRQLQNNEISEPDASDQLHRRIQELGGNPLPYGIDANRPVLEELIDHALVQGILKKPVDIEALFAPATRELSA